MQKADYCQDGDRDETHELSLVVEVGLSGRDNKNVFGKCNGIAHGVGKRDEVTREEYGCKKRYAVVRSVELFSISGW